MNAIDPTTRLMLAKLLGMLGSDHPGERDNAGRAAHRLVVQAGSTWSDVLAAGVAAKAARTPPPPPQAPWRRTVAQCLQQPGSLRAWERSFLRSLQGFPRLSPKQSGVLREIADRVLAK